MAVSKLNSFADNAGQELYARIICRADGSVAYRDSRGMEMKLHEYGKSVWIEAAKAACFADFATSGRSLLRR